MKTLVSVFRIGTIFFSFCLYFFLFIVENSNAQWQTDIRMTNTTTGSYTSRKRCILSNGTYVHILWQDARDGNDEIYYKRSTDVGINWGLDTRLTFNTFASWLPCISINDSVIHTVWEDSRYGKWNILYKRSTNNGITWDSVARLTTDSAWAETPDITSSGSVIHLVWRDHRDGDNEIYYKRSINGGFSWDPDVRLTNNSGFSDEPSIAVSGQNVNIVWQDKRNGNYEIYYKRSIDGGTTWGTDTRLTNNPAESQYPTVSSYGQFVHAVWQDKRDLNFEIYYKRSTDGGLNWGADTRLTNASLETNEPFVYASGSILHIVWDDARDGNSEIYYKRSTDAGLNWEADTRLTNNTFISYTASVSVSGSLVHVLWTDTRDGNYQIYYKRNPTGNVGIINTGSDVPAKYYLYQNYPNPFNSKSKIKYQIAKTQIKNQKVVISVYNITGKEVSMLVNQEQEPGSYEVTFDGSYLPGGVYFYQLKAGKYSETKKLILLK